MGSNELVEASVRAFYESSTTFDFYTTIVKDRRCVDEGKALLFDLFQLFYYKERDTLQRNAGKISHIVIVL